MSHAVRRRVATTGLLAGLLVALGPGVAAADPAGPTNYESQVTAVEPDDLGIEVEVLGGDAFVHLSVPEGVSAAVSGYEDGEHYLRFLPDGTVERNEASPTRWLNDARYGAAETTVPPEASADAPPRWEVVADGGSYAWHDHRVHWMSPQLPEQVDPALGERQRVFSWSLALTVDDQPVTVRGELDHLPPPSPALPVLVLVLVAGVGVAVSLRRPTLVAAVVLVGAAAAATVGVAAVVGLPPGGDNDPALVILPAVAVLLLGAGLLLRRRPGIGGRVVTAAAGVPLVVWGVLLVRSFTSAIVPTALPSELARLLVAVTLGAGLAALVAAARAVLSPPDLTATEPT